MLTEILKRCDDEDINTQDIMSMYQRRWMNKQQLEQRLIALLEQDQNTQQKRGL